MLARRVPSARPGTTAMATVETEGSSTCMSDPRHSMGRAAGGSSDSRSMAWSTVRATSSVVATAEARHPPRGSIGLRQGGANSTNSRTLPRGISTVVL